MADLVTIWAAFVGAVTTIGAGALKHLFDHFVSGANKVELQRDSDVARLESVVFEVRDLANTYWGLGGDHLGQAERAAAIIGRLAFIFSLIDGLFQDNIGLKERISGYAKQFHNSCTDGDFQVLTRKPDPDQSRAIEIAAYALVHGASAARRQLARKVVSLR